MIDRREQAAVLALVAHSRGEWYKTAALIEEARSAVRIVDGEWTGFEPLEVKETTLRQEITPAELEGYLEMIGSLEQQGVRLLTILDEDYPRNLREVYNRPPFLFVRGELVPDDEQAVAVVGTRRASPEGIGEARSLASQLPERGVTVLSGLALGIDAAAHSATLEAGGRTVAVMGTGIKRIYPAQHGELAEQISRGGALVSQFWPDAPPTKYSFPMRNVVMSGMAIGTVVVEASNTSGARMQARLALEHGKRLFLVESLVLRESWARRYAEYPGTTVVESVDDVVDVLTATSRQVEQLTLG
ncbi:MAG: DNA-processing protein DprA [Gaiellaceae bacterium]